MRSNSWTNVSHGRAGRPLLLASAAIALSLTLGGCGMSSLTSGLGGGMFGGSSSATAQGDVSEAELLAAAKASGGAETGSTTIGDVAGGCPRFTVAQRDNNLTVYEPGRDGDGLAIQHRGEITKTARECTIEPGGRVTIKYGFSGRVLLGPKGAPGNIPLPLSVYVTDAKREKIATDPVTLAVVVGTDKPIGYFSTVRTLSFNVPEGSRPGEFELVVGFENKPSAPPSTPPRSG